MWACGEAEAGGPGREKVREQCLGGCLVTCGQPKRSGIQKAAIEAGVTLHRNVTPDRRA